MPFRKRPTGAGLEIFLEVDRALLVSEFHGYRDLPWFVASRVWTASSIMCVESCRNLGRQADIRPATVFEATKKVDEPLRRSIHVRSVVQRTRPTIDTEIVRVFRRIGLSVAQKLRALARVARQILRDATCFDAAGWDLSGLPTVRLRVSR